MLDHEFQLNIERLGDERGDTTSFFAFADTVVARSYRGGNECHGWMGVKFQAHPRDEPSQIILHVRMLDTEAALQQEALGIVGVNLLYGAFFLHHEPEQLIESLLDKLTTGRIEIDMIEFTGIEFRTVDNRLMALKLVQLGLSGAAMFGPDREVLQPSEVLHKKAVLVERGSFRPPTDVNIDMLESRAREVRRATPPSRAATMLHADGDDHAQPARRRQGRRPPRLPRPRRPARRLRHDRADLRLLRVLPAGRLSRLAHRRTHRHRHGRAEPDRAVRREVLRRSCPAASSRASAGCSRTTSSSTSIRCSSERTTVTTVDNLEVDARAAAALRLPGRPRQLRRPRQLQAASTCRSSPRRPARGSPAATTTWEKMVPAEVAELIKKRGFFGYHPSQDE